MLLNKIHAFFQASAKPAVLATAMLAVLTGCESTEENEELRIAELTPLNITRHVDVVWREHPGSGVDNYYSNLRPVVVDKVIYTAGREGEVTALSLNDGDELWQVDTREPAPDFWSMLKRENIPSAKLSGGITAAYNNLYIGTENGEVIALSQDTGDVLWRTEVKGEVVAAPGAGEGWIAVTTTSGHLAVMHPDTGELRWQIETDVPALSLRGTSSPVIANGGVLTGTATGKLAVYLLDSGMPAWSEAITKSKCSTELEQLVDADSQPIVAGPIAYVVTYNGNLAAVDVLSGRMMWKREYSSYRNMTLDQGIIYLTGVKGSIIAIDAQTGVERWSNSQLYNRRLTQPVVYKDTVVVGDLDGYFHFVDKASGEFVSRFKLDELEYSTFHWFVSWFTSEDRRAYTAPVVAGDLLFTQTRDGEVTALRLP